MAADTAAFEEVFDRLKAVLQEYEGKMLLDTETEREYLLNTHSTDKHGKPVFFAGARINKGYVSYYLMPVYMFPELLEELPEGLKRRMQGKSCFNFTKVDEEALAALAGLTARGAERHRQRSLEQE